MRGALGRLIPSIVVLALAGCARLPKNVGRTPSSAIADTGATVLGRAIAPVAEAHPGQSGFLLYNTAEGALQARVALANVAQSSIDAQYFMWASDRVGRELLAHVIAAADRGVRVRLLIDDYHDQGHDLGFAALDAHPHIEVRVFNPFVRGRLRIPQFLGRFNALNRRMHNKLFVADGQVAVVGGRNLTDDYFGLGPKIDFRDFDLLAIGAVVAQAEEGFDKYWNSEWAYPIGALRKRASAEEYQRARARFAERMVAQRAHFPYALPRDPVEALAWLEGFRGKAVWARAEVVYDDPGRVAEPKGAPTGAVGRKVEELLARARREIVAENAYLIPDKDLPGFHALRARGVRVQVLTNSLASTDEVAVNAAYSTVRPALVELGVSLHEMKPFAASRRLYLSRRAAPKARLALHGKAAVLDREIVVLGSFNLDPRSRYLDTEVVFVVYSEELAAQLLEAFATDFDPANAWRIGYRVGKKDVAWLSEWPSRTDVEPHDPAGWWRRFKRAFESVLPIRSLL
jgi:cardiolipin synthase C